MKGKPTSSAYLHQLYKGELKKKIIIAFLCEDGKSRSFEINTESPDNSFRDNSLKTLGFKKEPNEENFKSLNGSISELLDVESYYFLRINNWGMITNIQSLV